VQSVLNMVDSLCCNQPNVVVAMSDTARLEFNFKIGVLKELHRRQLVSREELAQSIKTIHG